MEKRELVSEVLNEDEVLMWDVVNDEDKIRLLG